MKLNINLTLNQLILLLALLCVISCYTLPMVAGPASQVQSADCLPLGYTVPNTPAQEQWANNVNAKAAARRKLMHPEYYVSNK